MDVGDLYDVQQVAARVEDAVAGGGQVVVLGADGADGAAGGRRRAHRVVVERVVRERAARH